MEKVKKKLKIKLLLILLPGLGGTMFLLIIMMLILGGGTITETTQNTFQLRINERYYQKALTYADDIREEYEEQKERRKKGKTYKKIFKMDFEEFLTYALYKSDDWEKFNNKYLKEAYKEAEKGRNILNTVENITDLQEMVESAVGSFVGKYERMKISIRVYNDEETG
ncbi:hypothetical protein [Caldisalinibacter kiritimatiensis]|uniref:Uncharacterized protein n=1 Tax=Caldisalinibacter kiritimatiensis TaxID=1304284 RepID=R1AW80_9FIRM|nr:hypothetical protein [Caldisalinibacter kiritimatiensis]EOD01423.1 hypothetical protein L21TH_0470 [Caldisalinibacter kiritimatiensis]